MKYPVFLLMFVFVSSVCGAVAAIVFCDWIVGACVALFIFALSVDVCFFGSDREL